MPIRLKPYYDLKPCVLDLSSIKEITSILTEDFPGAKFSANRGSLQVYNEPRDPFIEYIAEYDSLESFSAISENEINGSLLKIEMTFNEEQARVSFDGSPEHEKWIDHFISDLNKQLLEPSFRQRLSIFLFKTVEIPSFKIASYKDVRPYCRIILKQKPSSPLVESIISNILSNIIWLILGMIILYIIQNIRQIWT
jgi:hypothetical protein